ncbi:hypothetical protein VTL71DRAFT_10336 [Oculimacula yallundae]|uniref:Uncharacterized protein n=1 Tax=Oculimacula yallundae TaxID=86028 RepID=A0ABR4CT90_9HELO
MAIQSGLEPVLTY